MIEKLFYNKQNVELDPMAIFLRANSKAHKALSKIEQHEESRCLLHIGSAFPGVLGVSPPEDRKSFPEVLLSYI